MNDWDELKENLIDRLKSIEWPKAEDDFGEEIKITEIKRNIADYCDAVYKLCGELLEEAILEKAILSYKGQSLSLESAATLAGMSQAEFLKELEQRQITPFQYTSAEILEEAK